MRFQIGFPSLQLMDLVDRYWSLESSVGEDREESELVVPNGMAQMIFHFGNPFYKMETDQKHVQQNLILCGPETNWARVTAPAGAGMFAVVFKPCGIAPFLTIPVGEIASEQVFLQDIMGGDVECLVEQLANSLDFNVRIVAMERFLLQQFSMDCRFSWATAREGARRIATTPDQHDPVKLAFDLGVSRRSLERLFRSQLGLSPKLYQRICRFQKAMKCLTNGDSDLAALSFSCGFYDQAHFCHEIKRFSGLNPQDLAKLVNR